MLIFCSMKICAQKRKQKQLILFDLGNSERLTSRKRRWPENHWASMSNNLSIRARTRWIVWEAARPICKMKHISPDFIRKWVRYRKRNFLVRHLKSGGATSSQLKSRRSMHFIGGSWRAYAKNSRLTSRQHECFVRRRIEHSGRL